MSLAQPLVLSPQQAQTVTVMAAQAAAIGATFAVVIKGKYFGHNITVKKMESGELVILRGLSQREVYADQSAFAAAYSLS